MKPPKEPTLLSEDRIDELVAYAYTETDLDSGSRFIEQAIRQAVKETAEACAKAFMDEAENALGFERASQIAAAIRSRVTE